MATAGPRSADETELPFPQERGPSLAAALAALAPRLESLADRERDQFPLWLPVGLILGISAWFWLPAAPAWTAFLLGTFATGAGSLALLGWSRWGRGFAIFSLAAALGTRDVVPVEAAVNPASTPVPGTVSPEGGKGMASLMPTWKRV